MALKTINLAGATLSLAFLAFSGAATALPSQPFPAEQIEQVAKSPAPAPVTPPSTDREFIDPAFDESAQNEPAAQQKGEVEKPKVHFLTILALALAALCTLFVLGLSFCTHRIFREVDGIGNEWNNLIARLKKIETLLDASQIETASLKRDIHALRPPPRASQAHYSADYGQPIERAAPIRIPRTYGASGPSSGLYADRPSGEEVSAMLADYRQVLLARGPDALDSFIRKYSPTTLVVSKGSISDGDDGSSNVWLVRADEWSNFGLVLPGKDAIRNWGTTFQPSNGRLAQNLFGHLYYVESGNLLEVEKPALVQFRDGHYNVAEKGILRGA
ncbi:hypothetical protein [Brevundimonas sp.]|uniref:hypothetical protein n=1 Tax=Brevundimonas sp. TaxID=1871086 RepID=UPI0028990346|nr:hypothetical protein [Brevundimonas sp.]